MSEKHLDYIDYFRAIAIIFIVAGHTLCWGKGQVKEINTLFFAGGTYFFVFIAGFLFQYLSYKFDIKTYFKKKLLNVIAPYLVTLLPVALLYTWQNADLWAFRHATFTMRFFAVLTGGYVVNGPVWFIGMISIIFIFSPCFLYSYRYTKFRLTLLLSFFILFLIVPRYSSVNMFIAFNPYESSLWHILFMNVKYYFKCFFHFTFIYLLGMEVCKLLDKYGENIRKNIKSIFVVSIFLYVFHFVVQMGILRTTNNMQIISKTIEIFVLLSGCMLMGKRIRQYAFMNNFMKMIANYSFGIFFLHGYLINYAFFHTFYTQRNTTTYINTAANNFSCLGIAICMFLTVFFGSLIILFVLRKCLRKLGIKNTRLFLGV